MADYDRAQATAGDDLEQKATDLLHEALVEHYGKAHVQRSVFGDQTMYSIVTVVSEGYDFDFDVRVELT